MTGLPAVFAAAARDAALEEAARWHDAEAARFQALLDRPVSDPDQRRVLAECADEHRYSANAIRAMKEPRP